MMAHWNRITIVKIIQMKTIHATSIPAIIIVIIIYRLRR